LSYYNKWMLRIERSIVSPRTEHVAFYNNSYSIQCGSKNVNMLNMTVSLRIAIILFCIYVNDI